MQEWNDGFPRRMQQLVAIKRKKMDSVRAGGLYIETNAQFIKAFGWEFLQSLSPYERKRGILDDKRTDIPLGFSLL